ncbi:MAG: hypothetical protein DRP09_17685 [Candidatus Thorarchaeota archaeon]|nr:MAG: hypothetical protein DRP09_17685 [Candidatus Thorarchaeota archaeon]
MAVWFVQFPKDDLPKPKQINMIDFHESVGKQWADYARILNSKGFMYGNHYAPWDIHKGIAGLDGNNLQWAKDAGIDFQPVKRSGSVMEAIELCRRLWRFLHFAPKCSDALDRLASYHEKTNRDGFGMGVPDHTLEESNVADSYRTMVEALARNIVRPRNMMRDDFSWFECPKFDGYFDG